MPQQRDSARNTLQKNKDFVRRGVIGLASGLLVLVTVFAAGPERTPGFARDLLWEDWDGAPTETASSPPATSWDADARRESREAQVSGTTLDPLPAWVRSTRSVPLWSRSNGEATELLALAQDTPLKVLGQPENGRLPVYYEDQKPDGRNLGGWVELSGVAAADGPPRIVASGRGNRPTPDISTPDKFIAAVADAARDSQLDSKVPASVTIAQAILESDWGKSQLAKKGQNYFGIKAMSKPGPAGVISMNTWEVLSGRDVIVKDAFRAYNNLYESVMDHGRFLAENSRYALAFRFDKDPREFTRRVHGAGYATDPNYSTKLINLMSKYNLFQYDLP